MVRFGPYYPFTGTIMIAQFPKQIQYFCLVVTKPQEMPFVQPTRRRYTGTRYTVQWLQVTELAIKVPRVS